MKPYRLRRRTIEVRWMHGAGWAFREKQLTISAGYMVKKDAIRMAAEFCRGIVSHGVICELVIFNRDGRIGTGSGARRSYGKDPKRSRG